MHDRSSRLTRRTVLTRSAGAAAAFALCPAGTACSSDEVFATGDAGASPPDEGGAVPPGSPDGGSFVLPREVGGIGIPDTRLAFAAAELAHRVSPRTLFNHVMRTYVFAALLFDKLGKKYDAELAFVGSALHDLGLVDDFMTPAERFELDGADAAMKFMQEMNVPEERALIVWDAIALHTSSSIAARKSAEIAMVSAGAAMDAAGLRLDQISGGRLEQVLEAYPRLGFKKASLETMLHLCEKKPLGQLMHPFAEVGRRHIPNFVCPTVEDLMQSAPFDE